MNINNTTTTEQNSSIIEVSENDFTTKVIEASEKRIILVDFWAPWCGPCKQLTPILEEVIKDTQGIVTLAKINIDENQQLAAQLRIQSIPTVMAFNQKKIVDAFQGVLPKQKIITFIEKIFGGPIQKNNSSFYAEAQGLINNNNLDQARNFIEEFLAENSDDTKAIALFITCLTELKKFDELENFVNSLSKTIVTNQKVQSVISNFHMLLKSSKEPSLEKILDVYQKNPSNVENIIKLSDKYFAEKKTEEALSLLIKNFLNFKNHEKEKIKKTLLKYFDILGYEHEKSKIYRRKLSSMLFS